MTGWIPITGSQLRDSSGALISNATITWSPVDGNGNPISFRSGGQNGQVIRTPVTVPVSNGGFAITLPDVSLCSPSNVGFSVTVTDLETGDVILGPAGYNCVQPSSELYAASWCTASGGNFDQYTPNLPSVPIVFNAGGPLSGIGPPGGPGSPGQNGESATIAIGPTTLLPAGSAPTVSNSGTSSAAVLNFGIPAGQPGQNGTNGTNGQNGQPGAAAAVSIGPATALPSGAAPTVTNSGTSSAAVLNFGIPAGAPGQNGTNGQPGAAATVSIGTVTIAQPGQPGSVTNVGTASAAVLNIVLPVGDLSIGTVTTLPAGSPAMASFAPGSDSLHLVLNLGLPIGSGTGGTGTGTSPTVQGLTLTQAADGSNWAIISSNGAAASPALVTSGSAAATPQASLTLVDSTGGYLLVTVVGGTLEWAQTANSTGAVASQIIADTVTGGTRTLTSVQFDLVTT